MKQMLHLPHPLICLDVSAGARHLQDTVPTSFAASLVLADTMLHEQQG